jgi:large subunit ribosomal protein L18
MAYHKRHVVPFRRKREGKTNYRDRLRLLIAKKPRMAVRKTNKHIIIQIISYSPQGDQIILSAHSSELKKYGWDLPTGNLPSAYLTGLLMGKKALDKGIKDTILDIGLHPSTKGSRIYAALKGVLDAGVKVPHSKEILPSEERISGKHISDCSAKQKGNKNAFTTYSKLNKDAANYQSYFNDIKSKIKGNSK